MKFLKKKPVVPEKATVPNYVIQERKALQTQAVIDYNIYILDTLLLFPKENRESHSSYNTLLVLYGSSLVNVEDGETRFFSVSYISRVTCSYTRIKKVSQTQTISRYHTNQTHHGNCNIITLSRS